MQMYMRFPEWRKKALTLSYDDNGEQNEKLVEILNRYGIKCTFNLNSGLFAQEGVAYEKNTLFRPMTAARWAKLLKGTPHEVAVHGLTHPHLEEMSPSSALYEILDLLILHLLPVVSREDLHRDISLACRCDGFPDLGNE